MPLSLEGFATFLFSSLKLQYVFSSRRLFAGDRTLHELPADGRQWSSRTGSGQHHLEPTDLSSESQTPRWSEAAVVSTSGFMPQGSEAPDVGAMIAKGQHLSPNEVAVAEAVGHL